MMRVRTPYGDAVDVELHGPEGAPAALFVQGAGPGRAENPIPSSTARLLAGRGYRAAVPERLGRGESAASGPVDLDRELSAITAVSEALSAPVVLIGHSSGCALAILAAAGVPTLAGVMLWEAPLWQFPEGAPAWWAGVKSSIDAGDLEGAIVRYMAGMPPEWIDELRTSPQFPALVHSWIPDGTALALVEERSPRAFLSGIDAPVLALVGTETFPGMTEAASAVAESAANGTAEELRGAWHDWDPTAMAERIARMLTARPEGGLRAEADFPLA
ncbi:alpha/beta hydrolase [Microbacterium azadirachtae]|uniref:alpha/beta hydrolase n=1 Tax=Microbacterium azadirachtae TaxID=582680 RepID=UPI000886C727|nr:alpha/beta fold hydrolase [Microbacterium azadirachtae]SDL62942.1 Lysophospholipase, alpha-beta hydrolase superfamily [Microbacterium azadirachtae]SEF91866.1 Lysophospholipase, alpha-beta hydrolase superfamily [Microbacterium azadirachtae]SEF94029.1 Lysophospholipase, alpha-beta hydrolase superfamily [Microbacterium azadirachtae]